MKLTRRTLLRDALISGTGWAAAGAVFGGLAPLGRLARAQAGGPDLYYVFAYFSGGWDILLSLDPRDPAVFTDENLASTQIQLGYDTLERRNVRNVEAGGITFGPFIGEMARHADKTAVVRGMSMETLTHETGRRRFLTGKPPSGLLARGSSAATHLAAHMGQNEPIPNLAIQVETYNADQPSYATGLRASGVSDLVRALRPAPPFLDAKQEEQLDHLLAQVAQCPGSAASPTWRAAEAGRLKARQMAYRGLDGLFRFDAPDMQAVRDHYRIPAGAAGLESPEAQAAMAAQALKGGVSRVVSIEAASGLDTHFTEWRTTQGPAQERGFNALARLIDDLAASEYRGSGQSWLEHTVVLAFSEFSRTALLNARGGRDHSLTAACLLAGAGIKPGAYGRSSDLGLEPMAVDLATGRPDQGGEVVRPEHILQTLFHNAGMTGDEADLRVGPLQAVRR